MAEEVITAAILNVDLRDNLLALSTHAHTGAAGDGDDELSGVDSLAFDDLAASPSAAGELQRNGVNLEWYGAAVVAITEADAVAGTASPRTLGTGAQQASAGDHTHTPSQDATAGFVDTVAVEDQVSYSTAETDLRSITRTPAAASRLWVISATAKMVNIGAGQAHTFRLYDDVTLLDTLTIADDTGYANAMTNIQAVVSNPSVALHTIKVTGQLGSGANRTADFRITLSEVKV